MSRGLARRLVRVVGTLRIVCVKRICKAGAIVLTHPIIAGAAYIVARRR